MSLIRNQCSVRELAQTLFMEQDLYPIQAGRPVDPEVGTSTAQKIQRARLQETASYSAEVKCQLQLPAEGMLEEPFELSGRADLICHESHEITVEELKCVREAPGTAHPADFGQALIYAALHSRELRDADADDARPLCVSVTYIQVDTLAQTTYSTRYNHAELTHTLRWLVLCWWALRREHLERATARQRWLQQRDFPFVEFRRGQRSMARRVFQAARDAEHLLLEAPTGSGKSLGVLFPALNRLNADEQVFFATSRNAGSQAAMQAVMQIDPAAEHIFAVEIRAKEKVCPVPGMPCAADQCEYAAGYFERQPFALAELRQIRQLQTPQILDVAERWQVCPFELSLDTAERADVIIGDYNYVYDPVVRIQRLRTEDLYLLTDEAHQLLPRVTDMLRTSIRRKDLQTAAATQHPQMQRRIKSIDRALRSLRRTYGVGTHQISFPDALQRAVQRFLDIAAELELEIRDWPELSEIWFACHRWLRAAEWYQPPAFTTLLEAEKHDVTVQLVCLDPAQHIRSTHDRFRASVRFSATVTPLHIYQRQHGFAEDAERAQNPFTSDQLDVYAVTDLPTYYNQRQRTAPAIGNLLSELHTTHPGHYLVALPSYAYLELIAEHCSAPHLRQHPGADAAELGALVDEFAALPHGLLFVVMGGSLSESVDLPGIQLKGVIVVGLGLPPPSMFNDLRADYFEQHAGARWGGLVAYTQPAMAKNLQAAGRLIRSPQDRGIICLIDPRFASEGVRQFYPSHWQVRNVRAAQLEKLVADFWNRPGSDR